MKNRNTKQLIPDALKSKKDNINMRNVAAAVWPCICLFFGFQVTRLRLLVSRLLVSFSGHVKRVIIVRYRIVNKQR